MKKYIKLFSNLSARRWAMVVAGVILLVVSAAAAWQYISWQNYVRHNDSVYATARDGAMRNLEKASDLSSIKSIADNLNEQAESKLCRAPVFTGLQAKLMGDVREYQKNCQQQKAALLQASQNAEQLAGRIETEKRVADILQATSGDLGTAAEGDYVAQREIWQQAREKLGQIDPDGSYEAVLESQLEAVDNIIKCYDDLIAANESESRPEFDDAAVELREAYSVLKTVGDDSKSSYRDLSGKLYDSISSL